MSYGSLGISVMPTTFRLGDALLNGYYPNKIPLKVFIQPNVSYGSLVNGVMPTTFRLGDTWLHETQFNHHKGDAFGLKLCNQGMIFFSVGPVPDSLSHPKVKCQLLIVNFVGFGCQPTILLHTMRQSFEPSYTQIQAVLVNFF